MMAWSVILGLLVAWSDEPISLTLMEAREGGMIGDRLETVVGDRMVIHIQVRGTAAVDAALLELPQVEGLLLDKAAMLPLRRVPIEGGTTFMAEFPIVVYPTSAGRRSLPPIPLSLPGRENARTRPLDVLVKERLHALSIRSESKASPQAPFLGETVELECRLSVLGDDWRRLDRQGAIVEAPFTRWPGVEEDAWSEGDPTWTVSGPRGLETTFLVQESPEEVTLIWRGTLRTQEALGLEAQRGFFWAEVGDEVLAVEIAPPEVKWRELPDQVPEDRAYVIGSFELDYRSSRNLVRLGEAFEIIATLRGEGPFMGDVLVGPPWESLGFHLFTRDEKRLPGHFSVTWTVCVESGDVREIPSIDVLRFDTSSEKFEVLEGGPIPLDLFLPSTASNDEKPSTPQPESSTTKTMLIVALGIAILGWMWTGLLLVRRSEAQPTEVPQPEEVPRPTDLTQALLARLDQVMELDRSGQSRDAARDLQSGLCSYLAQGDEDAARALRVDRVALQSRSPALGALVSEIDSALFSRSEGKIPVTEWCEWVREEIRADQG